MLPLLSSKWTPVLLKYKKPTWFHLLFLFFFLDTQHFSDINIPIFRSLPVCYAGLDGRSPTYSDTYHRSYWYNWLSWWWALGCSKHVENWNIQIYKKELCIKLVIYREKSRAVRHLMGPCSFFFFKLSFSQL